MKTLKCRVGRSYLIMIVSDDELHGTETCSMHCLGHATKLLSSLNFSAYLINAVFCF